MTSRRSFSSESSGNTAQTARDLGLRPDMIRRWRKRMEADGKRAFPGHGRQWVQRRSFNPPRAL
jgi:transposase-like protein